MLTRGAFSEPRAPERHVLGFEQGRPVSLDGAALAAGRADRGARGAGGALRHRPRHPPRATRSSAPRGAWPSRRRRPKCCSPRTASSRSWCSPPASSASRSSWRSPTATWCTRASCSTRCAATSRRCCCPRSSASPARCTCCCTPAAVFVEGVESPYSLMAASSGVYGEAAGEWTATDALGFSKHRLAAGHVPRARRRAREELTW